MGHGTLVHGLCIVLVNPHILVLSDSCVNLDVERVHDSVRGMQVNGIVCLNLPQNQYECLTSSGAVVGCSEPGVVSRTVRQFLFPPDISEGCPRCGFMRSCPTALSEVLVV